MTTPIKMYQVKYYKKQSEFYKILTFIKGFFIKNRK